MDLINFRIYFILHTITLTAVNGDTSSPSTLPPEARLRRYLLDDTHYDRNILPVDKKTSRVRMEISVNVFRINGIADREQEFSFVGNVEVGWNNPFLRWDPAKWGGVKSLLLKEDDLWLPDICVLERLDTHVCLPRPNRMIHSEYDGEIVWKLGGGVIKISCPLDVRKFPFDEQHCRMSVGSYIMTTTELHLVDNNRSRVIESMGTNSLWSVVGYSSGTRGFQQEYKFGTIHWEFLVFTVHLKRKPGYFITNIIAPCLLISFLMCGVFLLPPSGGEKIGFSITLLLAFNVIQLVILDTMPQTSECTPIISTFISALLILAGLCIPSSIFVIYIHHYGYDRFPHWLKRSFFRSCFAEGKVAANEVHENHWTPGEWNVSTEVASGAAAMEKTSGGRNNGSEIQKEVLVEINRKRETEKEEAKWEKAAKKMDRFFLKLFIVSLLLVNLACGLALILI